eukprot:TRINITY_DN4666_c0_g1_i1.p1 TRINITY_DN4666_c0_g1~~TRINITY_DN4666_c0_g1_i1.p1  ORF type:complete len:229 (+),score=30.09 TRINITY_DN4666_c0_g1_i1:50-688(+)
MATLGSKQLTFGKYAGKTLDEVANLDPGYCRWAASISQPGGQLKELVDYWKSRQCESSQQISKPSAKRSLEPEKDDVAKRQCTRDPEVLRRSSQQALSTRSFRLQQRYLDLIRAGVKVWEGRLRIGAAVGVRPGCPISFSSGSDELHMVVKSTREYKSFEDMLCDLGVESLLPGVKILAQGLSIYHSFPGYAQKELRFGVVAMELMPCATSP